MIELLNKDMQNQIPLEVSFDAYGLEKVSAAGNRAYRVAKRMFDVVVSLIGCLVLLLPMILVGVLIHIDSPGPVIFRQKRMGRNGKVFTIYKFRTMYESAPDDKAANQFEDADMYITKLGGFLRRTSIDELPQLVNVLRGEMSLVGYRPVCISETELNELRARLGVFAVRPGITGLAQVSGRDNIGYQEKAMLDAQYVQTRSIKLDLWCILKTVSIVFSGEGVK